MVIIMYLIIINPDSLIPMVIRTIIKVDKIGILVILGKTVTMEMLEIIGKLGIMGVQEISDRISIMDKIMVFKPETTPGKISIIDQIRWSPATIATKKGTSGPTVQVCNKLLVRVVEIEISEL